MLIMFFITNHENTIIAADKNFLEALNIDTIYEATLLVKNGEIEVDESTNTISYPQGKHSFSKTSLSTLLGEISLYQLYEKDLENNIFDEENTLIDTSAFQEENISEEIENLTLEINEDNSLELNTLDTLAIKENTDTKSEDTFPEHIDLADTNIAASALLNENEPLKVSESEEISEISDDTFISLNDSPEDSEEETLISLKESDDTVSSALTTDETSIEEASYDTDISLLLDDEESIHMHTADNEESVMETALQEDIVPNIQEKNLSEKGTYINCIEISELIGISQEEYTHFLEDFKKESAILESQLKSNNLKESREAISTLKEASLLLHLPHITEKLEELSNATSDEKDNIINEYLTLVAETHTIMDPLQTFNPEEEDSSIEQNENKIMALETEEVSSILKEEEVLDFEEGKTPDDDEEIDPVEDKPFNLENIQAIPFDFSINEAAEELTLPASLVSEFIVDFIQQAKENIPVLEKAYEEKDLDKIQKTAHMLKGASSNLRIAPMADTLYDLQFNEDFEKVPELIHLFTGQLKALSIQMDQI